MTKEQYRTEQRVVRVNLRHELRKEFRPVSWQLWGNGMALLKTIQGELALILEKRRNAEAELEAIGAREEA